MNSATDQPGDTTAAATANQPKANEQKVQSIGDVSPPLAKPLPTFDQGVTAAEASAAPEANSEMAREVAAADQRAAMADQWGLTEEQIEAFDAASEAPSQERQEVMMRFARGQIDEEHLNAELQAADERGLELVHEVLGDDRFQEYLSIRWHFEVDEPETSLAERASEATGAS